MLITSPEFEDQGVIPSRYTCGGDDVNPPLEIIDVSENAKSLALIVDDPDASSGLWTHWTVWNLRPQSQVIAEDSVPADAVLGTTDSGSVGYHGPCPPSGIHHYHFRLYALDAKLDLPSGAPVEDLKKEIAAHSIGSAELVGIYSSDNL